MSKTTTKGAAAAPEKKAFVYKPNHVGYITNSKSNPNNKVLKVEQTITLEAGQLLFLAPRDEEKNPKQPEWKLYTVNVITGKE